MTERSTYDEWAYVYAPHRSTDTLRGGARPFFGAMLTEFFAVVRLEDAQRRLRYNEESRAEVAHTP